MAAEKGGGHNEDPTSGPLSRLAIGSLSIDSAGRTGRSAPDQISGAAVYRAILRNSLPIQALAV